MISSVIFKMFYFFLIKYKYIFLNSFQWFHNSFELKASFQLSICLAFDLLNKQKNLLIRKWSKDLPGVNFINIIRANFSYECLFGSFLRTYVRTYVEKSCRIDNVRTYKKFVRKMLMKLTAVLLCLLFWSISFKTVSIQRHFVSLYHELSTFWRVFVIFEVSHFYKCVSRCACAWYMGCVWVGRLLGVCVCV